LHALVVALDGEARARDSTRWDLLLVLDPDARRGVPVDLLRRVYGLTAAEARVAQRLAQGRSIESIAADLGVCVHTARNHLKQIFDKTGTHRQAELVALLHAGPLELLPG
jgi:DNA-binding CsgD family transcriptional regulator